MDSSCNLRAEHNFILRSFHIERTRAPELGFRFGQSAELKLKNRPIRVADSSIQTSAYK